MPVKLRRIGSIYDACIETARISESYRNLGADPR